MHHRPRLSLFVALSIALAACSASGGPSPSAGSSGPGGSAGPVSSSDCPAAQDPGPVQGWGTATTAPAVVPVLINPAGELTCGKSRFLFSFIDAQNRPIATPDRTATLALYDLARDPAKAASTTDATFVWAIEGSVGIYVANVEFSEAGVWGAELSTTAAGKTDRIRVTFNVNPSTTMIGVGDKAPAVTTPTGDPAGISTDAKPDPRLYKTSVDEALSKHEPFVLVFATPKFCTSGQCGPTLDRVKPFLDKDPTMTFINVEPYELKPDAGGQLQPVMTNNQLTPTKPTQAWGLLSEPWLYVVDRNGVVTASLGLIFSDQELTAAIDGVK